MDTARERTAELADLHRRELTARAEFLVALADFDAKRLWVDLEYTSLFQFLRAELHLSKAARTRRRRPSRSLRRRRLPARPITVRLANSLRVKSRVLLLAAPRSSR